MPFRPDSRLETERLALRPPTIDDAEDIYRSYARDPEVTRYVTWRPHESIDTTRRFLAEIIAAWEGGERFVWVIDEQESGRLVGAIEARIEQDEVEIGYVFERRVWNRGYATEAARGLIDHVFASDGVSRVTAVCSVDHPASARVLEKCGMRNEGRVRGSVEFPNLASAAGDVFRYGLAKEA